MKARPAPGNADSALVYATGQGRMCPGCRQPVARCTCRAPAPPPPGDGWAHVSRETQRRGGKTVTVVRGLALPPADLAALGKALRSACGSGGTVKDGVLEIQGDHVHRVLEALQGAGHRARRAGG